MTGYKLGKRKNNINRNAFILGEIFKANDIRYERNKYFNVFYLRIKFEIFFINLRYLTYASSNRKQKTDIFNLMKKYKKENYER